MFDEIVAVADWSGAAVAVVTVAAVVAVVKVCQWGARVLHSMLRG